MKYITNLSLGFFHVGINPSHFQGKGATSLTNRKNAFTLVELIVVITILAILWTIAFMSLQWYSAQSRDSVRISDISSMKIWLELFNLDAGKYPIPTQWTEITYGSEMIWTQWYFWDEVVVNINKLNKSPTDPLTDKKYVYSTTNSRSEYQIAWAMEGEEIVNSEKIIVNSVLAVERTAPAIISWTFNWKVIKYSSWSLNCILALPSIVSSTGITLEYIVQNDSLAYHWYKNLQDAFTWTNIINQWPIQSILLTNTEDTKSTETISKNIVNNNLWGKVIVDSVITIPQSATGTFTFSGTGVTVTSSRTTVTRGTPVIISNTCSQSPTGYTSTGTNVSIEETMTWFKINTLSAGDAYISPVWWVCGDISPKRLRVTQPNK